MITEDKTIPSRSLKEIIISWSIAIGGLISLFIFAEPFRQWVAINPIFNSIIGVGILLLLADDIYSYRHREVEDEK